MMQIRLQSPLVREVEETEEDTPAELNMASKPNNSCNNSYSSSSSNSKPNRLNNRHLNNRLLLIHKQLQLTKTPEATTPEVEVEEEEAEEAKVGPAGPETLPNNHIAPIINPILTVGRTVLITRNPNKHHVCCRQCQDREEVEFC